MRSDGITAVQLIGPLVFMLAVALMVLAGYFATRGVRPERNR